MSEDVPGDSAEPKKSEEEWEEKDEKNEKTDAAKEKTSTWVLVWSIAIIAIIILGIFSVKYFVKYKERRETYTYNGFEFTKLAGLWYTQVQLRESQIYTVPLHYSPRDLENVSVRGILNDSFYYGQVYITFDPDEKDFAHVQLAAGELSLNLVQAIGIVPLPACTKRLSPDCDNRSIVTCDSGQSVIYLKQSDRASVTLNGRCVTVEGRGWDIVRATDRLILQWYRIMN